MGRSTAEYQKRYREEVKAGLRTPRKGQQRKGEDLICPQCGGTFYRPPANRSSTGVDYCSRGCMAEAYKGRFLGEKSPRFKGRTQQTCDNCGKAVLLEPWKLTQQERQGAKHVFCDRACFSEWKSKNWCGAENPAWVGGKLHYRGANWARQAREARRRDGHCCQFCGKAEADHRRALCVHHIRPFRYFGLDEYKRANKLANLVSLCDSCHTFLERFSADGSITDWATLKSVGEVNRLSLTPS